MITRLSIFFIIVLLLFSTVGQNPAFAQKLPATNQADSPGRTQPHTLLIKLKPDYQAAANRRRQASAPVTANPLQPVLNQIKATSYHQKFPRPHPALNLKPGQVDLTLWYEIKYQNASFSFAQLRRLFLATGLVEHVEPVYLPEPLYQPNDPLADSVAAKQYYLKQIQAYRAWDIEKSDSSIVIGILDTGTRLDHEDLRNNIKYNYADPVDGVDNDNDGFTDNFTGWDTADNDNDPTGSGHGTLVTGLASGTPDNGKGIAGTGFNCRYLPIKVFSSNADGPFGGYEGVKYAADHGCQVINLSWGGENSYSQFGQDVINYAVLNKNVVVVAAAGNTPAEAYFYPASYENVLAVGAVDKNDVKVPSQTFNYAVDITAPGINMLTTSSNGLDTYASVGGSSMAAPLVAGAAGLLRKKFPAYTARQLAEQLRVTADNNYGAGTNLNYLEKLGYGRLNIYRALTTPQPKAVRNTGNTYDHRRALAGNVLPISGTFENILAPTANLFVTLSSSSPYVTVIRSTYVAGAMATLASQTNTEQPFQVLINEDIPANQPVVFRYGYSDGAYTDYQYFTLTLNSHYVTLTTGDLDATITSKGNIGFTNFNGELGESVVYKTFGPMLREGGLLIGTSPGNVSDNLRNAVLESDENFTVLDGIRFANTGKRADEEAYGAFQDNYPADGTVGVAVKQRAFAWQNALDNPYLILEYQLTNTTPSRLINLHAGLFADWDVGDNSNNTAAWDSVTRTGYTYHSDQKNVYAGVTLLTPQLPTTYAISNTASELGAIHLTDGFTDAEKFTAIRNTSGQNRTAGGSQSDVAQVVGAVLATLAPGQSTTLAFALLGAETLPDLQGAARTALNKYQQLKSGPVLIKAIDSVCTGETVTLRPEGGRLFKFYADPDLKKLLASGQNFTTPPLKAPTTYYISNVDSLYESALMPVSLITANSNVSFTFSPNPVSPGTQGRVIFTNQTLDAREWHWDFGNGTHSQEQNPSVQYTQPGNYPVTLRITNEYGCTDSLTKTVKVPYIDYIRQWQDSDIQIYPIPTAHMLTVVISEGIDATQGLTVSLVNAVGQLIFEKVTHQTGSRRFDLSNLANGIYYLRVQGKDGVITRRIELLR